MKWSQCLVEIGNAQEKILQRMDIFGMNNFDLLKVKMLKVIQFIVFFCGGERKLIFIKLATKRSAKKLKKNFFFIVSGIMVTFSFKI